MKNMRTMRFTRTALKNLFSPPVTRPYPEQPREYSERTRGHVEIDIDTCILCGCCVETCPKKCLTMKNTYTQPGAEKTEDSFLKTNMPAPAAKPAAPVAKPQGEAAAKAEGSGAVTKAQVPAGKTEV